MKQAAWLPDHLSEKVLPWLHKGFWAVADQGLFAGSNFLLNILLARWLSQEGYGAFTVIFSTFLLAGQVHTALLTEPMMVFGAGRFKERFPSYLHALILWGHSGFAVTSSMLLALAALWFRHTGATQLSTALFGLALAQPFILFLWLMRRATYVRRKPHLASTAGALYLVAVLAGIYALYAHVGISTFGALLVMGAASLLAGASIMGRLKGEALPGIDCALFAEASREHWSYGRWAVATSVLMWVPANIYYLLLPLFGGLEASGALKALMNLLMPILHANGALSILLIPELVKAHGEGRLRRMAALALGIFVLSAVAYWLFIGLFGAQLMAWLYAGQYGEYAHLLWLLGLLPLLAGINAVISAALRALEKPDLIFRAYVGSTVVALTFGVACIALGSFTGVILAQLVTSLATVTGLVVVWRTLSSAAEDEEPDPVPQQFDL